MTELLLLAISIVLVAVCGLFVMAEFALITVNKTKVEKLAKGGDSKARQIQHALTSLSTQLSSAQVGITITNLAIGFLAEPAIAHFIKGPLLAAGVNESLVPQIAIITGITLATGFTMIFGELIPKNLAIARPLSSSQLVIRPLLFFTSVISGPIRVLNGTANRILRLFHVEPQEELASARSADELLSLVRRSAQKGTLSKETAVMLERSLSFGDQMAVDIMTPRVQVEAIQAGASVADALELARKTGLSRFPVYDENLDDIVGILHIKYAFTLTNEQRQSTNVKEIMHKPVLVPSTIELEPLLEALRKGGLQIAIVIDEFGGMDGIVTIEDVLEELVGEVRDEHDKTRPDVIRISSTKWDISGLLRPDEIADQLTVVIPEDEDVETIGGLIVSHLGQIPSKGDSVQLSAMYGSGADVTVDLTVKKMDGNRIDRVLLSIHPNDNASREVTS